MKKNILYASILTTMIALGSLGCGAEEPIQDNAANESMDTNETASDDIIINPNAGISPYYKETSEDTDGSETADSNDETDSDDAVTPKNSNTDSSDKIINATVYNTTPNEENIDDQNTVGDVAVFDRVYRDVYVSVYGSDLAEGDREHPFRTIQKALNVVSPGYHVYLYGGIYSGANTFTNSGTEDAPITVAAMPQQDVIVTLGYGESGAIFDINGQSNICIRELRIGYSRSDWVYGIYMDGGEKNITITDNDICNLATYNRDGSGYGGAYGVLMYGKGPDEEAAIENVSIDNNRIYTIETGHCEAVAASGNCDNIKINSNIVYDIMNIGIDLYGNADYCTNPALDQPRNCVVDSNTVYNCVSDNYAVAGIYIDGARDTEITHNILYENMYGIIVTSEHRDDNYPVTNVNLRNNTIHDNHDGGIAFGGYDLTMSGMVMNSEITDNLLYNNGSPWVNDGWNGEIDIEKCSNILISNNVVSAHNYNYPVIGSSKSIDFIENVSFQGNTYLTSSPDTIRFSFAGANYKGLSAWNEAMNASDTNTKSGTK